MAGTVRPGCDIIPVPGSDDCDGPPDRGFSWRPQVSQKSAASGNTVLQNGQFNSNQNPQRLQNLASLRFSAWQLEQRRLLIYVPGKYIRFYMS